MDSTECVFVFTVTFIASLLFVKALHDGASATRVVVVSLICALIIARLTENLIWILERVPLFGLDANPSLRRQVAWVIAGCSLFPWLYFVNFLWEELPEWLERRYPDHTLSFNGKTFVEYHGESETFEIPNGVEKIGDQAFEDCLSLTSINIPESVTEIGGSAFSHCKALKEIVIPESVTEIGFQAFWGCTSLTSLVIPESVTRIGDAAFLACLSLTSINIPEGVTKIGRHAFECCSSLTSINIPKSVTEIGDKAFVGCESLSDINVAEDNIHYCSTEGVLFTKDKKTLVQCPGGMNILDSRNT